jgi:hypothetical protein
MPIDLIAGTHDVHSQVSAGMPATALERNGLADAARFRKLREPHLIYD